MTVLEMLENVQQHHAHIGETEFVKLANRWLKDFAFKSRILYGTDTSITTTASTDSYSIPATMFEIEKVTVDGDFVQRAVGNYKIGDNSNGRGWVLWQPEGDSIRLVKTDTTYSYLDSGLDVVLYGSKYETVLTALADEPDMPEQFHEAIIFGILSGLYMKPPNLDVNMAREFRAEYKRILREAKHYARSRRHRAGAPTPSYF